MTHPFPLLGESLGLDLVNTRIRGGEHQMDLLDGPEALTDWLAAQSTRLAWIGPAEAADLPPVRTLRDAAAALVAAAQNDLAPPGEALDTVNAALALPAPAPRLTWTDTRPRMGRAWSGTPRDGLLRAVAADVAALLTGPDHNRLRTCEHPQCVLVFLARNPRRRWCSAAGCGNRARVARHYSRHRAAPPTEP